MNRLYLDFETRSRADIKKVGAYKYVADPSTEILCLAVAEDDSPVWLCDFRMDVNCKREINKIRAYAYDPEVLFVAHNAQFEMDVWDHIMMPKYQMPPIPSNRWRCTMAKCYAHGIPAKLERAALALQLPYQKDMEGNKVMLKLSKPNRRGEFWQYNADTSDDFATLYRYCMSDVEAERALDKELRDLSPYEQRVWEIDHRINRQGVCIDLPFVERAIQISERLGENNANDISALTGGAVSAVSERAKLQVWCKARGVSLPNTQKATIRNMLAGSSLPANVRAALSILESGGKAALAKYPAFRDRSLDGVVRETLQYHGAHTGRWAGRGVQLHNLKRPDGLNISLLVSLADSMSFESLEILYDDFAGDLSKAIRGVIVARPGKKLLVADYSQMESRVLAWLAGEQSKLDLFLSGVDLYCSIAEKIYGYSIDPKVHKKERQVGKVADLSLGYQGGIAAFANMARGYDVDIAPIALSIWDSASIQEKERADFCYMLYLKNDPEEPVTRDVGRASNIIKERWRIAHPAIVGYWADLEYAAIEAVRTGAPVTCRSVTWFVHTKFLFCKLPSGRVIAYPYPKVEESQRGKLTLSYRTDFNNQWIRVTTYGGSLAENLTQAVQRDLLVDAMVNMEEVYPWILHIHDEGIAEVDERLDALPKFLEMFGSVPSWGAGIPMKVVGDEMLRYGKVG